VGGAVKNTLVLRGPVYVCDARPRGDRLEGVRSWVIVGVASLAEAWDAATRYLPPDSELSRVQEMPQYAGALVEQ